ncbi:MAG: hypothetical protein C5B51_04865 [Terriglobia bacterium]|nr:MAG: hypothetical protein C5B51_04865 [Terriglobia bacterium]
MKSRTWGRWAAAACLLATGSLWAHHSPSAIFDMTKKFSLTGTVTKVEWVNPHIVIYMDAKDTGESWQLESNPPAWFRRVGVTRADFAKAIGQSVTIEGVRAKDGSLYGYLQKITLPDGNALELVSPGQQP